MHLLYLDESGSVGDPGQKYFVLAGAAVFERCTHWIEQELQKIASRFDPSNPSTIELHGSPMRSGRNQWRNFKVADRIAAIEDSLKFISSRCPRDARLFGAVVRKSALTGMDPIEHTFEQISSRFDLFLTRLYQKYVDPQRGIIVFDKASTEQRIQTLARDFKYLGHSWGTTRNYAEVPVFLDSRASRLIQLADLIAFALFRRYEHGDGTFFDIIAIALTAKAVLYMGCTRNFDQEDGQSRAKIHPPFHFALLAGRLCHWRNRCHCHYFHRYHRHRRYRHRRRYWRPRARGQLPPTKRAHPPIRMPLVLSQHPIAPVVRLRR